MRALATLLVILSPCVLTPFARANPAAISLTIQEGKSGFLAVGRPSALKIRAKGEGPTGEVSLIGDVLHGKISVKLESLDTGMGLRNRHMREKYLEVTKYPDITFTFKNFKLPAGWDQPGFQAENLSVPGTLALHGVSKSIQAKTSLVRKGNSIRVSTEIQVQLEDYAIGIPSFSGITVAEAVTGDAEFDLVPQK